MHHQPAGNTAAPSAHHHCTAAPSTAPSLHRLPDECSKATEETVSTLQSLMDEFTAETTLFKSQKKALEDRHNALQALL
jgi:hypothetical protein